MLTTKRKPATVGEILTEEFMEPMGLTQGALAEAMGVQRKHVNELCGNRRNVTAATANFAEIEEWSPFYLAARADKILGGMLQRGFTTVRDAAGADFGLARAVQEGLVVGPRLIFGGRGLSQTGGHGDGRSSGRTAQEAGYSYTTGNVVCDGVPEVRRSVREEIKRGAQHIKT